LASSNAAKLGSVLDSAPKLSGVFITLPASSSEATQQQPQPLLHIIPDAAAPSSTTFSLPGDHQAHSTYTVSVRSHRIHWRASECRSHRMPLLACNHLHGPNDTESSCGNKWVPVHCHTTAHGSMAGQGCGTDGWLAMRQGAQGHRVGRPLHCKHARLCYLRVQAGGCCQPWSQGRSPEQCDHGVSSHWVHAKLLSARWLPQSQLRTPSSPTRTASPSPVYLTQLTQPTGSSLGADLSSLAGRLL
jgi:hypothetical protein